MPSLLASAALLACPLSAQAWEGGAGVSLHVGLPMDAGFRQDLHGHPAFGAGLVAMLQPAEHHGLRVALDFTEAQVADAPDGPPGTAYARTTDYQRTWRLGAEHHVFLGGRFAAFYGLGEQYAWVARSEGSALGLAFNAFSGNTHGGSYRPASPARLEGWSLFASAGFSWRVTERQSLDLRWIGTRYKRFPDTGLSLESVQSPETRFGAMVELSYTWILLP